VTEDNAIVPGVNPNVPTIARVYDYWLGGYSL